MAQYLGREAASFEIGVRRDAADSTDRHDLVAQTIEHIESAKRSGKTLEEIQSSGLPEEFAEYGKAGFIPEDAWIQAVYASLEP